MLCVERHQSWLWFWPTLVGRVNFWFAVEPAAVPAWPNDAWESFLMIGVSNIHDAAVAALWLSGLGAVGSLIVLAYVVGFRNGERAATAKAVRFGEFR